MAFARRNKEATSCCRPPSVLLTMAFVNTQNSAGKNLSTFDCYLYTARLASAYRLMHATLVWFDLIHTDKSFFALELRSIVASINWSTMLFHPIEKVHDCNSWILRIQKRCYWCLRNVVVQLHTSNNRYMSWNYELVLMMKEKDWRKKTNKTNLTWFDLRNRYSRAEAHWWGAV
jgi:hypothetical protein